MAIVARRGRATAPVDPGTPGIIDGVASTSRVGDRKLDSDDSVVPVMDKPLPRTIPPRIATTRSLAAAQQSTGRGDLHLGVGHRVVGDLPVPTWLSVARAPRPLTSDALIASVALPALRSGLSGRRFRRRWRPLKVAAAMFASFAFVTASSEICPVLTWLSVAKVPSPLTSEALIASAVLASAAVRSVGPPVPARSPTLEGGGRHVCELRVRHRIVGDLPCADLVERRQGAEPARPTR